MAQGKVIGRKLVVKISTIPIKSVKQIYLVYILHDDETDVFGNNFRKMDNT
jgi:hypothetical protein